jgi:hypothetical protein
MATKFLKSSKQDATCQITNQKMKQQNKNATTNSNPGSDCEGILPGEMAFE